jgi:curved DNA-binding protein CbpA
MRVRNCYSILHVSEDADSAAIRHAFRSLVRRYHPDAGSGSSAQKFRDVAEAYEVLSDPQRKSDHDRALARSRAHLEVTPETLIPDSASPIRDSGAVVDFEADILRVLQLFEGMLRRM